MSQPPAWQRVPRRGNGGISHRPKPSILTLAEVIAIKQAHGNGLSKASLARTYDVGYGVIVHALKPGYYPRKES